MEVVDLPHSDRPKKGRKINTFILGVLVLLKVENLLSLIKTYRDTMMGLEKVESKKSLNIKISADMDFRLKRARKAARGQGMKFNVSAEVEKFLEKELKKVEKTLSLHEDYKTEMNQSSFEFEDSEEK